MLIGWASMGKTSAIRATAGKMGVDLPEKESDFCDHIAWKGEQVGFASMGDPGSSQEESLARLMQKGCEVIVGACRTRGNTTNTAMDLARKFGYTIIWTTPFNLISLKEELNDIYSDAVIRVIETVIAK